jgi:phosphatidate cytidylyltransferase
MLKQRLMTAAVLIPIVFISILFLKTSLFQWPLAIVAVLAALEWFSIIGLTNLLKKLVGFSALLISTLFLASMNIKGIALITSGLWFAILIFIAYYAHKQLSQNTLLILSNKIIATLVASLILALFWLSGIYLHQSSEIGPQQLMYVMVLVWLADTGGYFAGKRFGKRKLAFAISPNKTWEGVAGALALGLVWIILSYQLGISGELSLLKWSVLSLIALVISIIGDLFESVFKRIHNVKDSGNLLPGHGGILDRIDSLLAAIPVFVAGIYFLGV